MRLRHIASLLVIMVVLHAAGAQARPMKVVASIEPLATFIRTIGNSLVDVSVMVPPGASPATYEPKPSQMAQLSQARVYFAIGVPFEDVWLERFRAAQPDLNIVRTDKGIDRMPMDDHGHGLEPAHAEAGHHVRLDPHVWLSPDLAETVAKNIYYALSFADSKHDEEYRSGLARMRRIIHETDHAVRQVLEGVALDAPFMVYHPSWGYFARQYHLRQIPIEAEGKEPSPREMVALSRRAEQLGIRAILVQPQFSDKAARAIARNTGLKVDVVDPMASDWSKNLVQAARVIRSTLP